MRPDPPRGAPPTAKAPQSPGPPPSRSQPTPSSSPPQELLGRRHRLRRDIPRRQRPPRPRRRGGVGGGVSGGGAGAAGGHGGGGQPDALVQRGEVGVWGGVVWGAAARRARWEAARQNGWRAHPPKATCPRNPLGQRRPCAKSGNRTPPPPNSIHRGSLPPVTSPLKNLNLPLETFPSIKKPPPRTNETSIPTGKRKPPPPPRSVQDELARESYTDASVVATSYLVMLAYVALALAALPPPSQALQALVLSRAGLAAGGVLIVAASVAGGTGLASLFGVWSTLISLEVIPFLVLAVGVDNMFVLAHALARQVCVCVCVGAVLGWFRGGFPFGRGVLLARQVGGRVSGRFQGGFVWGGPCWRRGRGPETHQTPENQNQNHPKPSPPNPARKTPRTPQIRAPRSPASPSPRALASPSAPPGPR